MVLCDDIPAAVKCASVSGGPVRNSHFTSKSHELTGPRFIQVRHKVVVRVERAPEEQGRVMSFFASAKRKLIRAISKGEAPVNEVDDDGGTQLGGMAREDLEEWLRKAGAHFLEHQAQGGASQAAGMQYPQPDTLVDYEAQARADEVGDVELRQHRLWVREDEEEDMGQEMEREGEIGDAELRLRVREDDDEEVQARLDIVDLTAHTDLVSLPEGLRACAGRVQALAVRSRRLKALPAWLGELTGLTELRVEGCDGWCPLPELPDAMSQLTALRSLSLSGCSDLTSLPDALGALTNLKELDLSWCSGLTSLPEVLLMLTNLERLFLSGCSDLTSLPDALGALTNLKELDLSDCSGLTALPDALGALTNLQELVMSGCSGLTELPRGMVSLTNLQGLDLSDCSGLTSLPRALGSLTNLEELDLSECSGLTSLPRALGSLTNLSDLDLSGCSGLTELPQDLVALADL